MTIRQLYVADTNSVISYFGEVFGDSERIQETPPLSRRARRVFEDVLDLPSTDVRLSIPSVVFVEIHDKFLSETEFCRRFFYDVFLRLRESANVEIKAVDREVLEQLVSIGGLLSDHDLHDKIVLACAMMLECPLITGDEKIKQYVREADAIPEAFS